MLETCPASQPSGGGKGLGRGAQLATAAEVSESHLDCPARGTRAARVRSSRPFLFLLISFKTHRHFQLSLHTRACQSLLAPTPYSSPRCSSLQSPLRSPLSPPSLRPPRLGSTAPPGARSASGEGPATARRPCTRSRLVSPRVFWLDCNLGLHQADARAWLCRLAGRDGLRYTPEFVHAKKGDVVL